MKKQIRAWVYSDPHTDEIRVREIKVEVDSSGLPYGNVKVVEDPEKLEEIGGFLRAGTWFLTQEEALARARFLCEAVVESTREARTHLDRKLQILANMIQALEKQGSTDG